FVYYYSTNNVHVPYNPTLNVEEIRDVIANSCRSTFCTTPRAGNTDIEVYCNLQQEYDNLMIEFINGDYAKILFNLNSGEFSEDEIYNAMQLQSQLSSISNEMREISGNAIRAIIQDDVLNIELLKAWYTVIRTLTAKYALAEAHCYSSDFSLADMVLCEIPEIFEFNEFEVEEYENYMQFHNIKKNVLLSDRTWAELRDDEIAELQSVAEKQGRASTMAKGILCFFYDICYEDDDIIEVKSGETPILRTIKEKRKDNEDFLEFVVSDNVLKVNVNNVQKIEFFDVAGRIVCTESSKNNVTIGHLPSGVYIIKIYTDDLKVESRKFIKK
ncbi:MAG: T9SS type A sorting domain-containing protein, partial [Marinilabiliaceae bacterium]|nr:T9SS type A sorting domain-containing protein [Marinilabiliaceae bacterium]